MALRRELRTSPRCSQAFGSGQPAYPRALCSAQATLTPTGVLSTGDHTLTLLALALTCPLVNLPLPSGERRPAGLPLWNRRGQCPGRGQQGCAEVPEPCGLEGRAPLEQRQAPTCGPQPWHGYSMAVWFSSGPWSRHTSLALLLRSCGNRENAAVRALPEGLLPTRSPQATAEGMRFRLQDGRPPWWQEGVLPCLCPGRQPRS